MDIQEIENLKNWLVKPLNEEASEIITNGKKYWAACTLTQNLSDASQDKLNGLKKICEGPAQDGIIDARAIIFLLFTGTGAYMFGWSYANSYLNSELIKHEFSVKDIIELLRSKPLQHVFAPLLTETIDLLVQKIATEAYSAPVLVFKGIYVIVCELQKEKEKQRPVVIWEIWSEVFQTLCGEKGFGKTIAFISFIFMVYNIYTPAEFSNLKVLPNQLKHIIE